MSFVNECPGTFLIKKYSLKKSKSSIFNALNAQTFIKSYYFGCLKSAPGALVNISQLLFTLE